MKLKIGTAIRAFFVLTMCIVITSCQKTERPKLGDYPLDANPPGGPLKFYVAFDGTTTDPLYNGVDSIRANFPSINPLASTEGISGKAVQGEDGKAIVYVTPNDFKNSTSFSIAFWMKSLAEAGRTEFLFSLVDATYGWSNSAAFVLVENQTTTNATMKFGLMDQWLEGTFNKPLFDGNWHHVVYVYDETTSKMTYYFDGSVVSDMTPGQTDVKNGSDPRGKIDFSNATSLILAGWNKHGNAAGPTDDWIKTFKGTLDQFRLYGIPLSASEVQALYNSKL
ncbi:MAG: LamG domain-containing protein [Ginsengibacter sp.]